MNKYFKLAILALVVISVSCKKQNTATNNTLEGTWTITSFVDNDTDKTSQFATDNLTFDNKGNMSIGSGGMMMNMCSWSMTDSVYHFNMMGMHNNSMDALDGDWMMMNFSDNMCSFIDDNPNRDCRFTLQRR
jgi:hypothetical protein